MFGGLSGDHENLCNRVCNAVLFIISQLELITISKDPTATLSPSCIKSYQLSVFTDLYQILSIETLVFSKYTKNKKSSYMEPNSPLSRKGREPMCSDPKCMCRLSEFKKPASIKIRDLAGLHVGFTNKMYF